MGHFIFQNVQTKLLHLLHLIHIQNNENNIRLKPNSSSFVQDKTEIQSSDSKKTQFLYTHFKTLDVSLVDFSSSQTSTTPSLVLIANFPFDLHFSI